MKKPMNIGKVVLGAILAATGITVAVYAAKNPDKTKKVLEGAKDKMAPLGAKLGDVITAAGAGIKEVGTKVGETLTAEFPLNSVKPNGADVHTDR